MFVMVHVESAFVVSARIYSTFYHYLPLVRKISINTILSLVIVKVILNVVEAHDYVKLFQLTKAYAAKMS